MKRSGRTRWTSGRTSAAATEAPVLPILRQEEGKRSVPVRLGRKCRFRLRTERFRYTLEMFRDAYGPALALEVRDRIAKESADLPGRHQRRDRH